MHWPHIILCGLTTNFDSGYNLKISCDPQTSQPQLQLPPPPPPQQHKTSIVSHVSARLKSYLKLLTIKES